MPVVMNHLPVWANFRERTQESWRCNWYFSGPLMCRTSTLLLSMLSGREGGREKGREGEREGGREKGREGGGREGGGGSGGKRE